MSQPNQEDLGNDLVEQLRSQFKQDLLKSLPEFYDTTSLEYNEGYRRAMSKIKFLINDL